MKSWFRSFLPLLLLGLLGFVYLGQSRIDDDIDRLIGEEITATGLGAASLAGDLTASLRHLTSLTGEAPIRQALDAPHPAHLDRMNEAFTSLIQRNPAYGSLLWIDESGMERIRIDAREGEPVTIPRERLQSRAGRNDFIQAMKLRPGDFYFSRHDADFGQGPARSPDHVDLWIATPLADHAGRPRGILTIGLLMSVLLDDFIRAVDHAGSHMLLLSHRGVWLHSPPAGSERLGLEVAIPFEKRFPLAWSHIGQNAAGSVFTDEGLWVWQQVAPVSSETPARQVLQEPPWIVVSHRTAAELRTIKRTVWISLAPAALLTLVILGAISWLIETGGSRRGSVRRFRIGADTTTRWFWSPYVLALTLPFAMVWLRMQLPDSFGDARPFLLLFVLPITLSALFGGLGPGLVATAVSALSSSYFVIVPLGTIHISAPYDLFQWVLLIANGALISVLSDGLWRARQDAEFQRLQQAETLAALRESELRLRLAQEAAHAGTWEWYLGDNRVYWSETLYPLYGLTPGQCAPSFDAWLVSVHPDDRDQILQIVTTNSAKGEALELYWRVNLPEGAPHRWLMSRGQPVADEDGTIRRYLGIVIDITSRKAVENELEQHRHHLKALVDERTRQLEEANQILVIRADEVADLYNRAPCGYQSVDVTGVIVAVNDTELAWLGYERAEVEGVLHFEQLIVPEERAVFRQRFHGLMTTGTAAGQEFTLVRKDGSLLPVILSSTVVRDAAGQFLKSRSTLFDNHERKEREQQIAQLNIELARRAEEAEAATRAKSTFLANMSHEIRTPMNAVLGFCYLLELQPLGIEALSLVRKVHVAGRSLLLLINDILDFSKIEAQKLEIEQAPFSLMELLDEVAAIMTTVAHDKDLELIITPPSAVDSVVGDRLRLQQVLINLMSNAIKFTAQGEVELHISVPAREERQVHLRFAVRDTGLGIAHEQQDRIFSAFSQADESISREFGGTGLGLAISRQLVNLMGGVLRVNSTLGQGSEFWFDLSLPYAGEPGHKMPRLDSLKVLVADDSDTACVALATSIESMGWSAEVVNSGSAALAEAMARLDSEQFYNLLLLDWKMPGLDGLATTQAIRAGLADRHKSDTQAPIILMVTAYSRDALLADPRIGVVDGVLTKPVTPSSLYDAVSAALRRDHYMAVGLVPATPGPVAQQRVTGVRVLVVDDSDINREVAQGILEADGAVVTLARDGQDALDWLEQHPDAVDIVLMDIQMPRLDGYCATRRIREEPQWRDLPVIALTAGAFRSQRIAALEAGVNDFITKPFDVETMMNLIQRWTGHQPAGVTGNSEGALPRPTPEAALAAPSLPGIDLEEALRQWGQAVTYRIYLNKFVDQYARAGDAIAAACRQGDVQAATAQAHKLCGTAGTLRLPEVSHWARELETRLNAGEPVAETAARLQAAIDQVCASVAGWTEAANPPANPTLAPAPPREAAQRVQELLEALDHNDPRRAESALAQLREHLDDPRLDAIQACVTDFDFPGATTVAQSLYVSMTE